MIGNKEPLYIQVIEEIQQRLTMKEWDIGDKIPSEDELSEMFGVSRTTIREAISYLIERGVLQRRRGIGTFVSAKIEGGLENLVSVTQWIQTYGYTPGARDIQVMIRDITKKEKELFGDWDIDKVGVISRIRTADDIPVMHCVDILPVQYVPEHEEDLGESLFVYLEEKFQQIMTTAKTTIDVGRPPNAIAEKLNVLSGTPMLHLHQIHFNQHGRTILISEDYFFCDRFSLEIFRRRF